MVFGGLLLNLLPASSATSPGLLLPESSRFFVLGGRLQGGPYLNQTIELVTGIGSSSWTSYPSFSAGRYGHGAASVGGRIYIMGGFNGSSYLNRLDVFDPLSGAWASGPDMPEPLSFPAVANVGGLIFVFGGFNGTSKVNSTWVYDVAAANWSSSTAGPTALDRAAAVLFDGAIWVLGGNDGAGNSLDNVSIFDPVNATWRAGPALPQVRNSLAAAVVGGP